MDDNEFLLRCALTYNWDTLISFCDMLLEVQSSSVRDGDIDRHEQHKSAAKQQLMRKDQWGNTALHAACYNNPPLRVVTSILNCASAASLEYYHLILTCDESTALNIACATGASTDVIRVLLNPPEGLKNGGIAVRVPDSRGCTPLSEMTIHYELQRKSPFYARTALPLDQVDLIGNDTLDPLLASYWIKMELLIRSAWTVDSSRHGPWISLVHGTAAISESCPTVLTSMICRCYPAMTAFASHKGVLPLHLALGSCQSTSSRDEQVDVKFVRRRTKWIESLVDLYPVAVEKPMPSGRSVFCQAIVSGLSWHMFGGQHQHYTDDSSWDKVGALQYLCKPDPGALSTPDKDTGLYPFLLAATVSKEESLTQRDTIELDTIFCLLRVHPQLLENLTHPKRENGHG